MKIEELVNEIQTKCADLEDILYSKLDEYNERGLCDLEGEKDADIQGIRYQNEIVRLIREEQGIYRDASVKRITKKEVEALKLDLDNLIKFTKLSLIEIEDYMKSKEGVLEKEAEEEADEEADEEEVVHTATTHKCRRGLFFLLGGVTGAALLAAALMGVCQIKSCNTQRSNSGIEQSTEEDEEKTTEVPTTKDNPTESTEKTTEAPTETASQLVPGEYGTFTDIEDDEQVEARAQFIIDNYFAPFMDKLSPNERAVITKENIMNTIRTMNDNLPLDENGNRTKDGVTVDTYGQAFLEMAINNPSSRQLDKYYHVPLHMFAVDNTELSDFIKAYDEIYDKMIHGLNVGDDEEVQDAIACLGYKFYNEWYLQGADGSFNPHNLPQALKYFAWQATIPKYQVTGLESNIDMMRPVCIEVCYPYGSNERKAITVDSIYAALESGEWNHISAKLAGMDVPNNPWLPLFWQSLEDDLNWQYEHLNTLKLN